VICCNVDHATPFCPCCGKQLKEPSPLLSLLTYVRGGLKRVTKTASAMVHRAEIRKDSDVYISRIKIHHQNMVAQWQSWVEAIEAAIRESEGG
jgi:hypothetical protein